MDGCGSNPENMYGRTLQLYREYSRNAIVQIRNKIPVGFLGSRRAGGPTTFCPSPKKPCGGMKWLWRQPRWRLGEKMAGDRH